jgi:DNA-binding transcriptional MerR regulator
MGVRAPRIKRSHTRGQTASQSRSQLGSQLESGELLYRPGEVCELLGLTRRQLQYWAHTDLVPPSGATDGGHHRYSFEDLVALKAAARLLEAGVSVQRIRHSIAALRARLPHISKPLSELVLVATGDVVLVFSEGTVFEAISGQQWVFEVARFQQEIAAWSKARESQLGGMRRARLARRSAALERTA